VAKRLVLVGGGHANPHVMASRLGFFLMTGFFPLYRSVKDARLVPMPAYRSKEIGMEAKELDRPGLYASISSCDR
jgi:hypothetical protein